MISSSQQHRNVIFYMSVRLGKKLSPEIPNIFNLKSEKKNNHSVHLFCNTFRIFYVVLLIFNEIHMILKPMIFISTSETEIYSSEQ